MKRDTISGGGARAAAAVLRRLWWRGGRGGGAGGSGGEAAARRHAAAAQPVLEARVYREHAGKKREWAAEGEREAGEDARGEAARHVLERPGSAREVVNLLWEQWNSGTVEIRMRGGRDRARLEEQSSGGRGMPSSAAAQQGRRRAARCARTWKCSPLCLLLSRSEADPSPAAAAADAAADVPSAATEPSASGGTSASTSLMDTSAIGAPASRAVRRWLVSPSIDDPPSGGLCRMSIFTRPKSVSFAFHPASRSTFSSFRSRWITRGCRVCCAPRRGRGKGGEGHGQQ